ncbi:hypothetical protein [Grimontia marina]|uniref:hypothetical protein n=1 Tax=Grimontia marina TaxID=646534 RepID=UPI000AD23A58|nr:hypothetical protein [Grimontia marina]
MLRNAKAYAPPLKRHKGRAAEWGRCSGYLVSESLRLARPEVFAPIARRIILVAGSRHNVSA